MDVGVRELKQNLSEYLDRAARGEIIRVTDRGNPKAQISALPGAGRLSQGVDEGWIRPAARSGGLAPVARFTADRLVMDVLNEDRGE